MGKKRVFRLILVPCLFLLVFANVFAAPKIANIADTYNKVKDYAAIDDLIQKGGDINEWAKALFVRSQSAMHFAAEDPSRTDDIRELAKRGANVNVVDYMGRTPLHIAAIYKNDKAVEVLLELGADPSILDVEGLTPAEHAKMTAQFVPYGNSLMLPKVISPEDYDTYIRDALPTMSKADQTNVTTHYSIDAKVNGYTLAWTFEKNDAELLYKILLRTGLLIPRKISSAAFEYFRYMVYYVKPEYVSVLDGAYDLDQTANVFILKEEYSRFSGNTNKLFSQLAGTFMDYSVAFDRIVAGGGKTLNVKLTLKKKDYIAKCEFTTDEYKAGMASRKTLWSDQGLKQVTGSTGPVLTKKK
jgi:hypothetical protein